MPSYGVRKSSYILRDFDLYPGLHGWKDEKFLLPEGGKMRSSSFQRAGVSFIFLPLPWHIQLDLVLASVKRSAFKKSIK